MLKSFAKTTFFAVALGLPLCEPASADFMEALITSSWCEPGLIRVHDSPSDSTSKTGAPLPKVLSASRAAQARCSANRSGRAPAFAQAVVKAGEAGCAGRAEAPSP